MSKAQTLWLVQSWLFCASTVCAVERGIVVSIQDSVIKDFEAPGLVTGAFLVSNSDTLAHNLTEEISVPDGWQLISGEAPFTINPAAQEVRIVAAMASGQTPPGQYQLIYRVRDKEQLDLSSEQSLTVYVKPNISVQLSVLEAPKYVAAGASYDIVFVVKHTGNASSIVNFDMRSSAGFAVSLDSGQVHLAPNDSRRLTAHVTSARNLTRPVTDRLFIRAVASLDSLQSGTQAQTVVNIVPAAGRSSAKYRKLPSRLTTRYVGGDGADGTQVELAGAGPLDDKNHHIEYRFRGPRRFEDNAFGLRDEVFLKLRSSSTSIAAGDQSFAVSQLLERGRLGRGGVVETEQNKFEARAIGFQSRAQIPDYEAFGGYVGFNPGRRFNVRGNFLSKKTETTDDKLFSISTALEPVRQWKVNLETASAAQDSANADLPLAFSGRIDGRLRGLQVSLQKHIANREFHGQIQDIDQNLVDLFTPLAKGFGWVGAYRDFAENLEELETASTAKRERHYRTGLNFRNPAVANASLDFETHTQADELTTPEFDNRASLVVARLQKSTPLLGVSTTASRGERKNYLTDGVSDLESYRLSIDVRPFKGQSFEGWLQTGHSGYSVDTRRTNVLGLRVDNNVLRGLLLRVSVQFVDRDNNNDYERLQYDVEAQYEAFANHFITLKLRKRDYSDLQFEQESSYLISYQLPVGIPLGKVRDHGSLKGRIYDARNSASGGIGGALLRLGDKTTLSNKRGEFVFHSVKPGVHYLQIENAAYGLDQTPVQKLPIALNITGAHTESVELEIVQTGSVRGKLIVYGYPDENTERGVLIEQESADSAVSRTLEPLRALPECQLVLSSGEESISTTTAADGSFQFTKLRPGEWTLTIQASSLPDYHRLEHDAYEFALTPGQSETCELRVIPRTRRIIIAASGSLHLDGRNMESTPASVKVEPTIPSPEPVAASAAPDSDLNSGVADVHGTWYVQTGAYRTQNYAERKVAELRGNGYHASIVPNESRSGIFYQVRAGGFANTSDASRAALELSKKFKCDTLVISTQLSAIDHIATLARHLAPRVKSSAANGVLSIPANESGAWFVQLGAYRLQTNVDRLTALLANAGIRYELVPIAAGTDTITQVRVGGFDTKHDSKSVAATFDSLLESRSLVITSKTQ